MHTRWPWAIYLATQAFTNAISIAVVLCKGVPKSLKTVWMTVIIRNIGPTSQAPSKIDRWSGDRSLLMATSDCLPSHPTTGQWKGHRQLFHPYCGESVWRSNGWCSMLLYPPQVIHLCFQQIQCKSKGVTVCLAGKGNYCTVAQCKPWWFCLQGCFPAISYCIYLYPLIFLILY